MDDVEEAGALLGRRGELLDDPRRRPLHRRLAVVVGKEIPTVEHGAAADAAAVHHRVIDVRLPERGGGGRGGGGGGGGWGNP